MEELEYNQFYISGFQIRRVWLDGERWYSITDYVAYITKSKNPVMYIQILYKKNKDSKLTIKSNTRKFLYNTSKGKRFIRFSNLYGLYYITKLLPKKYKRRVKVFRSWIE